MKTIAKKPSNTNCDICNKEIKTVIPTNTMIYQASVKSCNDCADKLIEMQLQISQFDKDIKIIITMLNNNEFSIISDRKNLARNIQHLIKMYYDHEFNTL